ncbi:Eco57I restriction-modification methylase domain-containing protein [Burkholderia gladioli]|uniref:Eco57I restriction-modification methylase domain-containing protein n=1 Tax=Burkholderia gladioli TaxID=28095 RepID=UPI00163EC485|nr:type IIL restriction-modification enzyme MmeI [Burkholderia gladioli]
MNYPSIRIEGSILSPDVLGRLDDVAGQRPADFGLEGTTRVKDEIARAWADAQDYWRIFQRKLESLRPESPATTETRQQWVLPLLGLLGYQLEYQAKSAEANGKLYPLSHRVTNRGGTVVHVVGARDPAGLDRKPEPRPGVLRMSAHAVVQEYLNLTDELYALVTNGRVLRLLRDSSRLIKLTYLEFDLDRIFGDGLFADFAVLYRLLHASRLPANFEEAAHSWIERYHQDSLDAGSRIREGLSKAVEQAIVGLANGFLQHKSNEVLREQVVSGQLGAADFYKQLLRLIYRLLFLMVIEERGLVFPQGTPTRQRNIYEQFYSVTRLRRLSEKRHLADRSHADLWPALQASFRLFEADGPGTKLGVPPLAGDLFDPQAIATLAGCTLGNDALLAALRALSLYHHLDTGQLIRANYGALNVEEFGSVYEGLLEYEPAILTDGARTSFAFKRGDERANTGSHYTPDELVQPLIKHSVDHLITERLNAPDPQAALLSLRVVDVACGSGHILLAAARRIGLELAVVRTGEDQPSPLALRAAVRDVISHCIYGVDLNPLAVELCKVALWLEAHVPGEPLNFLDHHIKCGNAIVGYMRREDIELRGIPDDAFVAMPGDDREIATQLRQRNRMERAGQRTMRFAPQVERQLNATLERWRELEALPEHTPEEVEVKRRRFDVLSHSVEALRMEQLAALPIAQFYIPKRKSPSAMHITEEEFRAYWKGESEPQGPAIAEAWELARRKRFFHWFLAFPEVMAGGGFDCILGNPPYLGGQDLSGSYGHPFCHYVKWEYAPAGLSDLVVYFIRRIFGLLKPLGFISFLTTNSIKDGDIRRDGLEQIIAAGGTINHAVRAIKWPGTAKLVVAAVTIRKGAWDQPRVLDGRAVEMISAYLDDAIDAGEPLKIQMNAAKMFQGSIFLGDGFLMDHCEAEKLREDDPKNSDVLFPIINGQELNRDPEQKPGRTIINFFDWPIERAREYKGPFQIVERLVKPFRAAQNRERYRDVWWIYAEHRPGLTNAIKQIRRCFIAARTTKHLNFSVSPTNRVFSDALYVFTSDRWDHYAVVQSTLHEVWARKYSGALKQDLRYSPSNCFETFVFPGDLWRITDATLANLGEQYHEHRQRLMQELWVGVTDVYNLFHARNLSPELVAKVSKSSLDVARKGFEGLLELRRLHVALDNAVRDAYGWSELNLGHDFIEVETLPENDRVRYTFSLAARKEVLKRLLALNHERASQEAMETPEKGKAKRPSVKRIAKAVQPTVLVDVPAFKTVLTEVAALPNAVWASAGEDPVTNDTLALAAVLKAFAAPAAMQQVRLAALMCAEPRLFARIAPPPVAVQWCQLIGDQAKELPAGIGRLAPVARTSFGVAVKKMRARGELIEEPLLDTWAPGDGLQFYDTSGWANGRARWIVGWLKEKDMGKLLQGLPLDLVEFVNEQAA